MFCKILYNYNVATKVARADLSAELSGSELEHAVDRNSQQVYLALNTWASICIDASVLPDSVISLEGWFTKHGLTGFHDGCSSVKEKLLCHLEDTPELSILSLRKVFMSSEYLDAPPFARAIASMLLDACYCNSSTALEVVKSCLQVLCFLDRFTYDIPNSSETYKKFFDANRKCIAINNGIYFQPGETICGFVREEINYMLPPKSLKVNMLDCNFSSGSTSDRQLPGDPCRTRKTLGSKIVEASRHILWWDRTAAIPVPRCRVNTWRPTAFPQLYAVPKSFTSKRVIAPESAYMNYVGGAYLEALRRALTKSGTMRYINEQDQSINRLKALTGSMSRGTCTIDLSGASDSIAKRTFFRCCPEHAKGFFLEMSSSGFTGPNGLEPMGMLYTSGNRLCWLTEAVYFLAIARVACRLCGYADWRKRPTAYGDDLIVPSDVYDTLVDILTTLGHRVNTSKSYAHGCFRESCGIWAVDGVDVTPIFWPRRELTERDDLIGTGVELQHKFAEKGLAISASYAADYVQHLCPKMTHSSFGVECDDLWATEYNWGPYHDAKSTHMVRKSYYKHVDVTPTELEIVESFLYFQFLQSGPRFDDPLSELLGVSSPYSSPALWAAAETRYTLVKPEYSKIL